MRFTVVTYGTEGDTRPQVAVCRGLLNRGHEVQLFGDRSSLTIAEAQGIPARALAGDMKATVGPGGVLSELVRESGDVTQMAKAVARIAGENTASWLQDVAAHAKASDAILFSGLTAYVGLCAAEHLRLPGVGLGLFPMSPTTAFPSPLLRPWKLPGWLNRLSHQAVNALAWTLFRKSINAARRDVLGQAPRKKMWRAYPILYGVSRHLVPQPADWPEIWKVCGAWSVESGSWTPPAALTEFLSAGKPPIYVGFGSMAGFDKQKLAAALVEAVDGRRALFYAGWSGIDPASLPGNFFTIGATPHDWLFPRSSLVIHHGGAGTSHTASRAGVPSVVIPFAGDQFFWAGRLASAGVAPQYVPHARLDGKSLSRMIAFAEDPEVVQRAKVLGEAMANEDGVSCAVEHIERLTLQRFRPNASLQPPALGGG